MEVHLIQHVFIIINIGFGRMDRSVCVGATTVKKSPKDKRGVKRKGRRRGGAITLLVKLATNLDVRGRGSGADIIRYDHLTLWHSFIPSAADVAEADKQVFVAS